MVALNNYTLIMYKHWGLQSQHFGPTRMEQVFCFHKQNMFVFTLLPQPDVCFSCTYRVNPFRF